MAERDLIINIQLNKTQAQQAGAQFEAGERARIKRLLTDEEAAEIAKVRAVQRANAEKIKAIEKAAEAASKAAKREAEERKRFDRLREEEINAMTARAVKAANQESEAIIKAAKKAADERKKFDRLREEEINIITQRDVKRANEIAEAEAKAAKKAADEKLRAQRQADKKHKDEMAAHNERLRVWSKEEIAQEVQYRAIEKHNRKMLESALASKGLGKETQGLGEVLGGLALKFLAVHAVAQAFDAVRDAATGAKKAVLDFGEKAVTDVQNLKELAAARGVPVDTALALDVATFARDTKAPIDDARQYLSTFEGSTQDVRKTMGDAEYQTYKRQAFRIGRALGVPGNEMATFAGQIARRGEFDKSEPAMNALSQSMKMLEKSSASTPQLITAANRIVSQVNKDEYLSQVSDVRDVMPIIGLAEETFKGQGGDFAQNFLKGLRNASRSDRGKEIGLDPTANVTTTTPQLLAYFREQAAQKRTPYDVLKQDFGIEDMQVGQMMTSALASNTFLGNLANARKGQAGASYFAGVTSAAENTAEAAAVAAQSGQRVSELKDTLAIGGVQKLTAAQLAYNRVVEQGGETSLVGRSNLRVAELLLGDRRLAAQSLEVRNNMLPYEAMKSLPIPFLPGAIAAGQEYSREILQSIADGISTLVGYEKQKTTARGPAQNPAPLPPPLLRP